MNLRLSRDPARPPALLCPGRAGAWWWLGDRAAWTSDGLLWVEDGDDVLVIAVDGVVDVVAAPGGCVAVSSDALVRVRDGRVRVSPLHLARAGADVVARWRDGWSVGDLPLPDGARRARDLWPFLVGRGAVWRCEEWLYRGDDRGTVAVARSPRDAVRVGPYGALLFGDDDAFHRAAPPGGRARPLPVPLLRTDHGVRWGPGGRTVSGIGPDGGVTVDLVTGAVHDLGPVLPVGDGVVLDPTRGVLRRGADVLRWGLVEASVHHAGALLGGPGGVVWDLDAGRPRFTAPRLRLGATTRTDAGWATAHFEGEGAWIDDDGGVFATFHLPVADDDVLTEAWPVGDAAVFASVDHTWRVDGTVVTEVDATPPPPRDVDIDSPLPLTGACHHGGRTFAWSDDGLLVVS